MASIAASLAAGCRPLLPAHVTLRRRAPIQSAIAPSRAGSALESSGAGGRGRRSEAETRRRREEEAVVRKEKEVDAPEAMGMGEFVERSRDLARAAGGGPAVRWLAPVECGAHAKGSPLLLYLPGIDGVGLGLIRHHRRLGKIFDVWCLHIPVADRTSFQGLVEYVESTVKSENSRSTGKPIYIVGESLGACIALAVAARNPNIDFVLVLANPATSFSKSQLQSVSSVLDVLPGPFQATIPYVLNIIAGSSISATPLNYGGNQLLGQGPIGGLPDTFMLHYLSFLADILPKESFQWRLKVLKSASLFVSSRLYAVKAQILILASGKDQLFPSHEEAKRLCKALPNSRIRHFKNSGHTIFLERDIDLVTTIKGAGYFRRSREKDYVSDYLLPSPHEFQMVKDEYRWIERVASPVMFSTLENGKIVKGIAGVPSEGPAVFVGYHMLMGLELGPLVIRLKSEKGILLRGIAHPFMFNRSSELLMPDFSSFDTMRIMGAVPVSATNFYKLLSTNSCVLLYPGGAREALHRKGEQYKLFWPEQSEFIRTASRFGAKIIPFGVVGEDDIVDLALDYDDLAHLPLYDLLLKTINQGVRLRSDSIGEVKNQDLHLPVLLPKIPGRIYYLFGKPIETRGRREELKDKDKAHQLYMHVKSEVENCLDYLLKKRERDPYRNLLPRLIYQATHGSEAEIPTFEP